MKVGRFFVFLLVIFIISLAVYAFTTPSAAEIQFTGIIMGNDYIASPLVQGRLERLLVQEGTAVKKGELIAEIDPRDLEAVRDSAAANIRTFQARLRQSDETRAMDDQQTSAALQQTEAAVTAARAQLQQAKTTLALNEITYQRDEGLFRGGVLTAQERDTAEENYFGSQANVKALEDEVRVAEAQWAVAKASRKQVEVQQDDMAATRAQLAQAVAQKDEAQTQLGYTKVYSPADGIVSVRVALQGETVQAGGPIVTVLDIDHLWVQADTAVFPFGRRLPDGRLPRMAASDVDRRSVHVCGGRAQEPAAEGYRVCRHQPRPCHHDGIFSSADCGLHFTVQQVLAANARLQSAQAQLDTANALHQRTTQQLKFGRAAQIDVNRSQVEVLLDQQQLVSLQNDLAKQKINLARLTGLPPEADYELSDDIPYAPAPVLRVEDAIKQALEQRADLKAAEAQVKAAERALAAARAERFPSASASADYGEIGVPSELRPTYTISATLNVPIWNGGRTGADIQQAQAALAQRRAELEDTRSQIESEVRNAYLDLEAAVNQVKVAQQNIELMGETLHQTRQRFEAGVSENVEVVQSQESVAGANLDYIDSVFAHNLAKLALARALGNAANKLGQFLPVQQQHPKEQ